MSGVSISSMTAASAALRAMEMEVNNAGTTNKVTIDQILSLLPIKDPCVVATTANITLSGTQTIDGVAVVAGNRVLVKNQTTASTNGIYVVAAGAWTRSVDADTWLEIQGMIVPVMQGTAGGDRIFLCTNDPGGTLGTTNITFAQIAGSGTTQAGTGISVSGQTVSLANTAVTIGSYGSANAVSTFTVDQQGRLTAAGTASIAIDASAITTGVIATARLASTGTASSTTFLRGDGTWATPSGGVSLTSVAPSNLGATAAVGTGTAAAREDHVHAFPTAAQVGAVAAGAVTTSGLTQNTGRLLGRTTTAAGAIEEITPGTGLNLAGGVLSTTHTIVRTVFTASGTWTKPANLIAADIEVIGGGGGGGSVSAAPGGGGGGGAGGYAKRLVLAASLGATETVTIGAAGSAASSGGNGGTGGTSSFGTWASATGGNGGQNTGAGGVGGQGSSGDISRRGGPGDPGHPAANVSGSGGVSVLGGGAVGVAASSLGNAGETNSGGGGSGGANTFGGGAGGSGIVIVTEYRSG